MNRINMITLSVGLLLFVVNMPCAACWDDDDDDWYDYWDNDWWDDDDDYAWWIELPEVVITPDNNDDDHNSTDDDDNDWWRRDYDDWDDNDNYDDDDWGEDEDAPNTYNKNSDSNITERVEKTLKDLSQRNSAIQKIINDMKSKGKFVITSDTRTYYDPATKCIYIGQEPTDDKLLHELIHKMQDDNGTLNYDKSSINNEYETCWLTFLCNFLEYGGMAPEMLLGLSGDDYSTMISLLDKQVDWDDGVGKPKDGFYDTIEQYTKGYEQYFSDQHKDLGRESYTNSFNPTYNYDWENNMKKLGY